MKKDQEPTMEQLKQQLDEIISKGWEEEEEEESEETRFSRAKNAQLRNLRF